MQFRKDNRPKALVEAYEKASNSSYLTVLHPTYDLFSSSYTFFIFILMIYYLLMCFIFFIISGFTDARYQRF